MQEMKRKTTISPPSDNKTIISYDDLHTSLTVSRRCSSFHNDYHLANIIKSFKTCSSAEEQENNGLKTNNMFKKKVASLLSEFLYNPFVQ